MDLGYCVVYEFMEQGLPDRICVVTSRNLEAAQSLVERLSGYYRDHERYQQKVFDLTKLYHQKALDMPTPQLDDLKQFSPEAWYSVKDASPVDYTVQVFSHYGTRHWINRKWDTMVDYLNSELEKGAAEYKRKRSEAKVLKNSVAL